MLIHSSSLLCEYLKLPGALMACTHKFESRAQLPAPFMMKHCFTPWNVTSRLCRQAELHNYFVEIFGICA